MKIFPLTKVRRMVTRSFLLCGILGFLPSPAFAFPWKAISEIWWTSAAEDHRVEFASSFENGRYVDYRPEYGLDIYYRILAETDEMVFIIKRKVQLPLPHQKNVKPKLFFEIALLCLYPAPQDGFRGDQLIELTRSLGTDEPGSFITDPEYFTLPADKILERIKNFAHGRNYIPLSKDLTCRDIGDVLSGEYYGVRPKKILPGIEKIDSWDHYWIEPYGGPRTPYPRSQFSSLGAIHFVDP